MNLVVQDQGVARDLRLRLWAEHLGRSVDDLQVEPVVAFDTLWKPVAEEQLQRRQQGSRPTHHLVKLPHVSRRSSSLLGPVSGLLVDG